MLFFSDMHGVLSMLTKIAKQKMSILTVSYIQFESRALDLIIESIRYVNQVFNWLAQRLHFVVLLKYLSMKTY